MIVDLTELFPIRKSFTDVVSYATDSFAAVEGRVFDLPADIECGDVIGADGALYTSGDDAYVVVSDAVSAGDGKTVNVLRAPNVGSFVALKADNLNAANYAAAITTLESKGFVCRPFFTS
ncbi:TPA: hypothetical protein QCD06_003111 [Enterobacter hormaechei]|nr:hypothetical protein [Enterobacter hormaechei]